MSKKLSVVFAVLLLLPLLFAAPAAGQEEEAFNFYAALSGDEEVPPVETDAQGAAGLSVNESDPTKLDYVLITFGLEDTVQAHIHLCGPGENGPVVAFLFSASNGPVTRDGILDSGTITEDELIARTAGDPGSECLEEDFGATMEELLQHMRDGDAYVNAHTVENPGGEIRGQVDPLAPPESPGGTFVDDDGNLHEGNIETIAAAAITLGCTADGTQYCPADSVTREQMASFIVRAFGVPPSDGDFFTDDEGSIHEDDINALAAAGITKGCVADSTQYCPTDPVTREQMASFLSRGLALRFSNVDFFTDDDDSIHEPAINALAASGITLGCSADGTLYCPIDPVPRDQMASFLARSLELRPMPPPSA